MNYFAKKCPSLGPKKNTDDLLAFGPLLHVIAGCFLKQIYFVAEEWPEYLHPALKEVHAYGGCSGESCRWASHDYGGHRHAECPLLVKTSPEVEANSSSSAGHTHMFSRYPSPCSWLSDDSEEIDPAWYLSSGMTQLKSRQQTVPYPARSLSPGEEAQHGQKGDVELGHTSGDARPPSRSLPVHRGLSDALLFPGHEPRPEVASSHNMHDHDEGRDSSLENREARNSVAFADITQDGSTNFAHVDYNDAEGHA